MGCWFDKVNSCGDTGSQ